MAQAPPPRHCRIGPFRIDGQAEVMLRGQEPVALGRKAIGLLMALAERPGELVTKEALLDRVWGGMAVEEGNLTAQVAALRRAFATEPGAAGWIETLPRRGYRFVGPVAWETLPTAPPVPAPADDGVPSIAVLPFRTTGPDPVPAYVADGLVEDVIASLAGLAELTVISRGSSFRFRDTALDLTQVGRELGVRYIVSGSLRRVAERIRVSGELAEAATGAILSSRAFDGEAGVLFDAQDRMVAEIVRNLAPRVRDEELRRIRSKTPADLRAYDLVLQARELVYRLDRGSFERARPLLDQAIVIDPGYAAAYALCSEWHSLRLGQGWSADPADDTAAIERFALQAIERDPTDVRALVRHAHGRSLLHRDYAVAIALFERALDASPNSAVCWLWSSCTHAYLGDGVTAVKQAELALRLSPRDWFLFQFYATLCFAHYVAGTYAEAVRWGLASIAENPRYLSNLRCTIAALVADGDVPQARALARDVLALEPSCRVQTIVARHPYQDPVRRERYGEHLLAAGLPA